MMNATGKRDANGQRSATGRRGEDAAALWLEGRGHNILSRNWRGGRVELDIVSIDPEGIHFVEVKSRTAPVMADPAVNVNYTKQQHLVAAARRWLKGNPAFGAYEVFFDIITVIFDHTNTHINYYQQAFIPTYA